MAKSNSAPLYEEIDIQKILADFHLPNEDELLARQRRNIDGVRVANELFAKSIQSVMRNQSSVLRQMLEEAGSMLNNRLHTLPPEEMQAKQSEILQKVVERGLANMKEMIELAAKSNMEVADVIGKRTSESIEEIRAKITDIARH